MVVWKVCSVSGQSDGEFKRFQKPVSLARCGGCVLQTSLGNMNRSRHRPLHVLSMSLGTEDCSVQMKGDPKASPGHEERPVNLFRQTSLSAVHSNQNTR